MDYVKIPGSPTKIKKVRAILKKFTPIILIATGVIGFGILIAVLSGASAIFKFAFGDFNRIRSTDDKVNVLLLGIAGGTHDGANLTDTIMVASYNLKTNQVYLISVPRDLWMDDIKNKVNAAYEIGLAKGDGLGFAKNEIGSILGSPLHYGIRIDFRGFVEAVNQVGGLDLTIDNPFDDYFYPIEGKEDDLCGFTQLEKDFNSSEAKQLNIQPGKQIVLISPDGKIATDSTEEDKGQQYFRCRYEHVSFKQGPTHMDGATALIFVRSRHGTDNEGTDFARSKRQQKILEAFRDKILSLNILTSPKKIKGLTEAFGKSVDTDIPPDLVLEFVSMTKKISKTSNFILGTGENNRLLINPLMSDYGGAWVLVPADGNFNSVREYVKKVLSGEIQDEATATARTSDL